MSIRDFLKDIIPQEKLSYLPKGFEVIGDIAIISIPTQLDEEKYLIAEALASQRKDIMVVLRKTNKLHGSERVGEFEILMGDRTTTVHRENGCVFHVDIARSYFSGRMYFERKRIVELVKNGEDVLVLFCGAGPFLIPIAKTRNVNIIGLENNPFACTFCKKNAKLNKIDADIILGDANSMNLVFRKDFDRIVMPTPYGQDHFLNLARSLLKPEGIVHFYTFKKDFEIIHFKKLLEEKGWNIRSYRKCGSAAPRVNRYVFDMQMI